MKEKELYDHLKKYNASIDTIVLESVESIVLARVLLFLIFTCYVSLLVRRYFFKIHNFSDTSRRNILHQRNRSGNFAELFTL